MKIEGHGRPTKYKAAEKGTIYTDLDTGKEYECKGTNGFIDVDLVDEPVEYKWELIDKIDPKRLPEALQFGGVRTENFDDIIVEVRLDTTSSVSQGYKFYDYDGQTLGLENFDIDKDYYCRIDGTEYLLNKHIGTVIPILTQLQAVDVVLSDGTAIGNINIDDASLSISGAYDVDLTPYTIEVYTKYTEGFFVTIDPKYLPDLPDDFGYSGPFEVNVEDDGEGGFIADMDYYEIADEIEIGKDVVIKYNGSTYRYSSGEPQEAYDDMIVYTFNYLYSSANGSIGEIREFNFRPNGQIVHFSHQLWTEG